MDYKITKIKKYIIIIILLFLCLIKSTLATDKMSLSFFDSKLKIGGDFYIRYETRSDYYTKDGKLIKDKGISSRQRLSFEFIPVDKISFTLTLLKTVDWSDPHPTLFPYAYDHEVDIQQAYILFSKNLFNSPISIWIGRREIEYLDERLIGHSYGWTDKPINFDGAGIIFNKKRIKIDIFYLNQVLRVLDETRAFDDDWFGKPADLYGTWFTFKEILFIKNIDIYFLFDNRDDKENSYTPGIRIYGKRGSLDYDINFTLQFGKKYINNKKLNRNAQAFYFDISNTFKNPFKLKTGLQYNYASGDDNPNDNTYHTFDQLYGCVHGKYGLMDFFAWQNMHDLYFYIIFSPIERINILSGIHAFWLDDTHDAWYNAYKKIQRYDPTGKADSFVGSELDFLITYKPHYTKNVILKIFYGHFFAGSYVNDTGEKDDADYFYFQIEYQF